MNIPCFLIPALVGLISGILGYLLGKLSSNSTIDTSADLQADLDACRSKSSKLQAKINDLEEELKSLRAKASTIQNFASTPASIPFDANLAFGVFGKKIVENDLKIVEGIGPKIEELFHQAGIKTWGELGATSVEKCQSILDAAGERFVVHTPTTWPKQAEMAYLGKWQELKDWQDRLKGGK